MTIDKVAETLKQQAYIFSCSYKTAWKQWMHPAITDNFTFDEVMDYIEKKR